MKSFGHTLVLALLLLVGAVIVFPGAVRGDETTPPSATPAAVAQIIVEKSDLDGAPIANVLITVALDDGSQPAMQSRTNALGQASFAGIPLGRYTVTETVPAGQIPVTTITRKVHLAVAGQATTVTFVNDWTFTIDGYTLNDLGQALPGWTIVASNAETNKVFRTVSDQAGYFRFDQVTAGTWTVNEIMQPGWTAVTSSTITIAVTTGASPATVHFKNATPCAMLDVVVISDATPRAGVSGVEITVQPGVGAPLTGRTGSSGRVHFACLPPGEYSVDETIPAGWLALTRHPLHILVEASGTPLVVTLRVRQEVARATPSAQPSPVGASASPAATGALNPTATSSARASVTPTVLPVATVGAPSASATSLPAPSTPGVATPVAPAPAPAITAGVQSTVTPGSPAVVATSSPAPVTPVTPATATPAPPPAITVSVPATLTPVLPAVVTTTLPALVTPGVPTLLTPAPSPAITVSVPATLTPVLPTVVTTSLPALITPGVPTLLTPAPSPAITVSVPATLTPGLPAVVTTGVQLPITTPTAAPVCRVKHLIRWGDTLSRIAVRYRTTVKELMTANNLRSTTIYTGRQLCIP